MSYEVLAQLKAAGYDDENDDPFKRLSWAIAACQGKGMDRVSLSLGHLTDASLIQGYVEWKRLRTGGYGQILPTCMEFAKMMMKPDTGYLTQLPAFGASLETPVSANRWGEWCRANYMSLLETGWDMREDDLLHLPI